MLHRVTLAVQEVDKVVDMELSKKKDNITYQRKCVDSPEKIVYSTKINKPFEIDYFDILLYSIHGVTEISFPLHVEYSRAFPFPSGGRFEILTGGRKKPIYDNDEENAIYDLCHSVWHEVTYHD